MMVDLGKIEAKAQIEALKKMVKIIKEMKGFLKLNTFTLDQVIEVLKSLIKDLKKGNELSDLWQDVEDLEPLTIEEASMEGFEEMEDHKIELLLEFENAPVKIMVCLSKN